MRHRTPTHRTTGSDSSMWFLCVPYMRLWLRRCDRRYSGTNSGNLCIRSLLAIPRPGDALVQVVVMAPQALGLSVEVGP